MPAPAIYNIPSHVTGDSWDGIQLITISINSAPPAAALASAKIQFRKTTEGSVTLELSTEDDTILILDADNWEINVPKMVIDMPAHHAYVWDLQTIDANGDVKTYIKGEWEVLDDVTR